jgi:catechol 2,3-dioxygenase-like lactoylglutathione lyase family enzyme
VAEAPVGAAPASGAPPAAAPPLTGVLETALYVADVDRSAAFYQALLGARVLLDEPGRMRALDVAGRQVLLLFLAGASDGTTRCRAAWCRPHDARGRIHVCFAMPGRRARRAGSGIWPSDSSADRRAGARQSADRLPLSARSRRPHSELGDDVGCRACTDGPAFATARIGACCAVACCAGALQIVGAAPLPDPASARGRRRGA